MPTRFTIFVLHAFVILFALTAVLGTLPAYDPSLSRGTLISILAGTALYFVTALAVRSRSTGRLVAGALVATAALVAVYFITQFKYQNYPETPAFIERLGNLTSVLPPIGYFYIHPNAAATLLELFLPVALAFSFRKQHWGIRLIWLAIALVMLYAVFLTYSRGSWVGLAAGVLVAFAVLIVWRLPRLTAFAIIGVLVAGIAVAWYLLSSGRLDNIPAVSSFLERGADRLNLYRNSLYLARDYLFSGIGLGDTFGMVYARYSLLIFVPYLSYAHNLPLAVWLGQGILGLVALGGIVIAFYSLIFQVTLISEPTMVFHGAWIGVTATLLHGLTDARQYTESPLMMPLLFVMIGLVVSLGRTAVIEAGEFEPQPIRLSRIIIIGGAAAALFIGALAVFNRPLRAMFYTNMAAINEARAELTPNISDELKQQYDQSAHDLYQQALDLVPDLSAANRRLGNLDAEKGQYDAAIPLLEKAYAAEPDYVATVKGLGMAYVWTGRTEDAARVLSSLANTDDMVNELDTWGQFRTDQKQPLLAAYAWETAAEMRPNNRNVSFWLAIADRYREAGNLEDAHRWYRLVLEVDPANERAKTGLNG